MAEKIIIDLEAKTDKAIKDVKALKNEFDNLESSVNDVSDASDKTKKSIDEVTTNGGAIAILDQLTGGLATQFKNAYESTRLFNFSLKGTKKALIASGIGLLVVALGTVVAYWDDIVELINRANKKLAIQESYLTEQLKTQTLQLELLKQQIDIEILRNGESPKLTAEYRKQLLIQREQNIALLENLKTQLEIEESKNEEVTLWERIKIAASGQLGIGLQAEQIAEATNKNSERSIELTEKLNEAKKRTGAIDLQIAQIDAEANKKKKEYADEEKNKEKQKADDLEQIRKDELEKAKELAELKKQIRDAEAVTEEERRQLEIEKTTEHYDNLIALAKANGLSTVDLEKAKINALDEFNEQSRQTNLERQIAIAEAERNLEEQKIRDKQMVVDAISQFADAETGIGKALLIAKQTLALKETLIDIKRITFKGTQAVAEAGVNSAQNISESSKIGFPQNLITIAGAIAQGVSIIGSVKKAVSKTKASVGSMGASVPSIARPSASSQPPAFNVVGASGTNQLADAIGGQSQEPVRAFVVSNDVTTAQSMDRNIVDGASI